MANNFCCIAQRFCFGTLCICQETSIIACDLLRLLFSRIRAKIVGFSVLQVPLTACNIMKYADLLHTGSAQGKKRQNWLIGPISKLNERARQFREAFRCKLKRQLKTETRMD